MLQSPPSIETRQSWVVATVCLIVITTAFGAPWIATVSLKDIAGEVGGERSIPALGPALAWFGSGLGGIMMGRIADRFGVRWTALGGAMMIGLGLCVSTYGPPWPLWLGHGLFIGLIGLSGINAPLYVYTSRWFDRRRGSALALISSGSYLAGAFWPPIFERATALLGWRDTMLIYAVLEIAIIVPLAAIFFRRPPEVPHVAAASTSTPQQTRVLGWPPNLVFVLMCLAMFLCCVPMSIPQAHLVALCSDLGISRTIGATMLSVLLGTAFLSRQAWGAISDRIGGLQTVLIGSVWQASAMTAFLFTQNEAGLFTVSAVFGLGFSGMIPAYVLAARELFPPSDASWRIPTLLLCSGCGMASGGWIGGVLYDHYGYYAPAFMAGIASNLVNFAIVAVLVWRQWNFPARAQPLTLTPSVPS
jgi:MFS family permease